MRRMGIEPAKKKERIVKAARETLFPWLLGKGLFLLCNGVSVDSTLHKPRFETLSPSFQLLVFHTILITMPDERDCPSSDF